jgi:hypothetical protein
VKGRTIIETNSTTDKKGTKYHGEFIGKKEETLFCFFFHNKILTNQNENAILKLKTNTVVIGKLFKIKENKFSILII